jgi:hypothetical protein
MKGLALCLAALVLLLSGCAPPRSDVGTPTPTGPASLLAAWNLWDPTDQGAPALIQPGTTGYRLKADWAVASIEYLYGWWGLGKRGPDHQLLEHDGTGYKRDGERVSEEDMNALVSALDRLYPTQMMLTHQAWTDDYPQWTVEITGKDGQHILLDSSSTGNPGNAPWNVLYNGRLYAQYDGTIGGAIGKLFGGRLAEKEGNPFGDDPSGQVQFSTGGWPPQLTFGFSGLVPVANGFSYSADPAKGEITGEVTGRSRIGSMERGEIDKLLSVKLLPEGKALIECTIETLPEGDPFTPVTHWKFTCATGTAAEGERYRIPISVQFGTEKGTTSEVKGELFGIWRAQYPEIQMPPPVEVATALPTNARATDLLTDHVLSYLPYSGENDPKDPTNGTLRGEIILLGQTDLNGKRVRYTVGTPFIVEKQKVSYLELDRSVLDDFLQRVGNLPTTKRVLEAAPDTVINMWYAKDIPSGERFQNYYGTRYQVKVNPCGDVPGAFLPSEGKPFLAFGYNLDRSFDRADFVLINDLPVVSELDLFPLHGNDPARKVLLPTAFDTGTSRAFQRVWMQGSSMFEHIDDRERLLPGGTELTLYIPDDSSQSEREVYEKVARALPGSLEIDDAWWTASGLTFVPGEYGALKVVSCGQE